MVEVEDEISAIRFNSTRNRQTHMYGEFQKIGMSGPLALHIRVE